MKIPKSVEILKTLHTVTMKSLILSSIQDNKQVFNKSGYLLIKKHFFLRIRRWPNRKKIKTNKKQIICSCQHTKTLFPHSLDGPFLLAKRAPRTEKGTYRFCYFQ